MKFGYQNPETIREILNNYRSVAVVGLSDKEDRPSFRVAAYLQKQGYRIIPVNPRITSALGEKAYPDLQSVPEKVEIVDIFRESEDVGPIVDAAIEKGAQVAWMQEGVVNEDAAHKASDAGLYVIMDRCMMKEHARLRE